MDITNATELGAWFTWDHAWDTPQAVVDAAGRMLHDEFKRIPWTVAYVAYQPYESSKEMRQKVLESGVLLISNEGSSGPLHDIGANLTFRAVHDQHHVLIKAPFNFPGEARASAHMLGLTDEYGFEQGWSDELVAQVKAFFFSEMMGQVSYYYCNGRQYLDEQYAVRYSDEVVATFQQYWTREVPA